MPAPVLVLNRGAAGGKIESASYVWRTGAALQFSQRGRVHLSEILALRPVPAAAVFLALTRRCPLSCAHCSTNSTLTSEEYGADSFLRFVESFTPADRPELILMSGGEALLRPNLVRELAERARTVGCRSYVLSGMFFARARTIPKPIRRAIDAVDHFAASLDVFHEREVARADVFRVLAELLDDGKDVSMQVVGLGADDPYLAGLTDDIRRTFDDRVPVLVGGVGPVGRAAEWLSQETRTNGSRPEPEGCTLAAWPLVTFNGSIVACCNQDVVDASTPPHLSLGDAAFDDWPTVRDRYLRSSLLRAIRLFGPEYLADRYGSGAVACDGYCSTCVRLGADAELESTATALLERPAMQELERQALAIRRQMGAAAYARAHGIRRYSQLVELGAPAARETRRAG
jgi:pyruvate-formate lyase-activating enzyme